MAPYTSRDKFQKSKGSSERKNLSTLDSSHSKVKKAKIPSGCMKDEQKNEKFEEILKQRRKTQSAKKKELGPRVIIRKEVLSSLEE